MISFFFLTFSSFAINFNSTIHQKDMAFKAPLFQVEVRTSGQGEEKTTEAITRDAKTNAIVLQETTKTKNGDLVDLKIEQKQTAERGSIRIQDGQVHFEYTNADGKTKKESEKIKSLPVIASSNFLMFIQKNWDKLESEKEIEVRLAVWDRAETVGFEILREKTESTPYGQAVVVKMKPSSFVISALVKPIYFWFSVDGTKLLMMKGRVGPKVKEGNSWKPLDADVLYEWVKEAV